jgi:hypothetical protein
MNVLVSTYKDESTLRQGKFLICMLDERAPGKHVANWIAMLVEY